MNKILFTKTTGPNTKLFRVEAPLIAAKQKAGQFVILRVVPEGERIPLTIASSDVEEGSITLIVQGIGKTTKLLNALNEGDFIQDVVGPLGTPSHIENFGTAISIGGGVGTAIAFSTAKALKEGGNEVISIIGGRSKEYIILEDEMREFADDVIITTDDGSYGTKGFVTDKLKEIIESGKKVDYVLAIGPIPMMKAVAELTRPYNIKTVVSLNPIMIDGTGMCGCCRAIVDNKTVFVCVDGPEFDAHKVDFSILSQRNRTYLKEEKQSLEEHVCRLQKLADEASNG